METTNQIQSLPRIGEKAPSFKAVTTQGEISFPEQYAGSWVILFSHAMRTHTAAFHIIWFWL